MSRPVPARPTRSKEMKHNSFPTPAAPVTLQDVIDRLGAKTDLSDTRKRDLRSAIVTYSKILGESPAAIPMDLAAIRRTLDSVVPLQAKVSRKRWANLRSDIAAAIAASGLQPMLKTADVEPDQALGPATRGGKRQEDQQRTFPPSALGDVEADHTKRGQ